MVLVLTRKDVQSVLTMKDTISAVEGAFRELAQGTADMPLRPVIRPKKHNGMVSFMPAYLGGMDGLGVKVVSIYPDNPTKYNQPTTLGTILLNDPKTGGLQAIMDGAWITAMRTGAVSGVASRYLAREDAGTVGIFGAGVQAKTQLVAVNEVRKLKEVKVFDVISENARKFSEEMTQRLGIKVVPQKTPEDVVKGSDIVIAATTSKVPVFDGQLLTDGTHVNGIGSHQGPGIKELDEVTIKRAKVVVDQKEAALKEAGDLIDPISKGVISADHIHAELGELVTGTKEGRTNNSEITVFKSVGLAIQDVSTAAKVYELARAKGIGKTIEI
jgi:ornithine cyclodeaminase/alanine dehydrogenase